MDFAASFQLFCAFLSYSLFFPTATTIIFFIFSHLYYLSHSLILNLNNVFCGCETCQSYLTSSWSKNFPNLCDWFAYLLRNSPTNTIHIHVLGNTITSNPENVEYMLKTKFDNFPKGKTFSMILGDFLGRGIFNVDGELWKFQKMEILPIGKSLEKW